MQRNNWEKEGKVHLAFEYRLMCVDAVFLAWTVLDDWME